MVFISFQVFTAMTMLVELRRLLTSCELTGRYQRFGRTHGVQLRDRIKPSLKIEEQVLREHYYPPTTAHRATVKTLKYERI
jgi:hypothetical protein